ncbi:VPS9 domain-containing protein 1 [Halotydeus destructor]|nr:VPS9 domain-containing protein 1 [Halotydeus destructor]
MPSKKEVFGLIRQAQDSDSDGLSRDAFSKYLQGVNLLSKLILDSHCESVSTDLEYDQDTIVAVKTLKYCTERLDELTASKSESVEDVIDCTTVPKFIESQSSPVPPSLVSGNRYQMTLLPESSAFKKASRDNMLLTRVYQSRISRCRDVRTKGSLQLELERRMMENIALAKKKDAEEFTEKQKRSRKALREAAEKLVSASKDGKIVFQECPSNGSVFNQQMIYAQILQYTRADASQLNTFSLSELSSVMTKIMNDSRHPLSRWLQAFQLNLCDKIDPLLTEYEKTTCHSESQSLLLELNTPTDDEMRTFCDQKIISKLELEAYERHLEVISDDIKAAHDLLTQMFIMMISSNGPLDISNVSELEIRVADYLFSPLWPRLTKLFSIIYKPEETNFRLGSTNMLMSKSNEELAQELSAGFKDESVISEFDSEESAIRLRSVIPMVNPYRKLKLITSFLARLCTKVKTTEQLGADQLVPLLVLLLLKCGSSQLVVECESIERMVNAKYLLGQDGYCLSSVQTALKYIEMHGKT